MHWSRKKRVFIQKKNADIETIPVLRLDKRVTDVRDGQVLLQVLILLTGLIVAPHYICKSTGI